MIVFIVIGSVITDFGFINQKGDDKERMNTKKKKPIKNIADSALREWLLTVSWSENTQRIYKISMRQFREFTGKTIDIMSMFE